MFILPVTRDAPVKHTAWVVYGLILANVSIFLLTCAPSCSDSLAHRFGFIPANHEPFTVLTSMFLHASLLHILGNLFFLWMVGEYVENVLGHLLTLLVYLACGVCGAGLLFLGDPHSQILCIGASGAISGMVGMYMVLFPTAKMDLVFYFGWCRIGTVRTNALVAILAWLGEQSLLGLLVGVSGWRLGIAFLAHVGGLLGGVALGLAIIRSGIASGYRRMIAKKAAHYLRCPACRTPLSALSPGHHNCSACGATFRVDEQGEATVSDPAKKAPSWLVVGILLLVIAGIVQRHFNPSRTGRQWEANRGKRSVPRSTASGTAAPRHPTKRVAPHQPWPARSS
jgi:membrane associated rhomboid family serine protease